MNRFLVLLPLKQTKFGKRLSFKWPENVSIFWEISVWTSRRLTDEKIWWTCCLFGPRGKNLLSAFDTLANWLKENTNPPNLITRYLEVNYWQKRRERRRRGAGEGLPYFFIWTDPKIKQPLARHWCQNSALLLNDIVQYRKNMCTQWLYCY